MTVAPGSHPAHAGIVLHHAFAVLDLAGPCPEVVHASNALALSIAL